MKLLAAIIGLGVGAIAISLANTLLHLIFMPQLLKDGQYVLAYLLLIPQGAWLGAFTGFGLASVRKSPSRKSGITLRAGGGLFLIFSVWYLYGEVRSDPSQIQETVGYFFLYFWIALAWSIGLMIWGSLLVRKTTMTEI